MPSIGSRCSARSSSASAVEGDWDNPYTTMNYAAEAQIARELMKFAASGTLYRGSKPVMWSVVEKTALAEAEVEYEDYTSDQAWVKFPVCSIGVGPTVSATSRTPPSELSRPLAKPQSSSGQPRRGRFPAIGRSAIRAKIKYGLYRVTRRRRIIGPRLGDTVVLADRLAEEVCKTRVGRKEFATFQADRPMSRHGWPSHPLGLAGGYDFAGAAARRRPRHRGYRHRLRAYGARPRPRGFRRSGPRTRAALEARGIRTAIPYTVDENGAFTADSAGLHG